MDAIQSEGAVTCHVVTARNIMAVLSVDQS